MHTGSSWISRSAELILKYFMRSSRFIPDSSTKILLNHHSKIRRFHLSRISGTLASVICYLRSIQIICTSPGEHLILSSIGASLGNHQDLIGSGHQELKSYGVPDEHQDKTTGTNEGTSTKPEVPDVPKDLSESENKYCGDSGDEDRNDDDNDDANNDDDDIDSDADGDNDASDSERTDSDEDENPTLNLKDDEEEEYEEEYVCTPDNYEFSNDEEYEKLYKDVNVRLKDAEHEEEGKGDA
ncbi:hypothetical protein Tco_0235904 [Tanacetum coccineum]